MLAFVVVVIWYADEETGRNLFHTLVNLLPNTNAADSNASATGIKNES